MQVDGGAEVKVSRYFPVGEMEGLRARAAVYLRLDSLGMGVRGQLLTGVPGEQEKGIVLGVGHLEFVRAERADFFRGGIGVNEQGFGRAARAHSLESDAEIIGLQGGGSGWIQVRRDTWKSSTEGATRWAVRRRCHWCSVFLVSELSTRAACSSWKFLIRDIAPYTLVK